LLDNRVMIVPLTMIPSWAVWRVVAAADARARQLARPRGERWLAMVLAAWARAGGMATEPES
jgi:hypothetical protein